MASSGTGGRSVAAWMAGMLLVALAGCGGGGGGSAGGPGAPCSTNGDCAEGLACRSGRCATGPEAGMPDGGPPDAAGDAAPDAPLDAAPDGPACPSGILCGAEGACCEVGQECIEGACVAACPSGVRCGADRLACCDEGEVCLAEACTPTGAACADSFDCPEGRFCEPTLGRCLPQLDPVDCELPPVFGDFEVTVEWSVTEVEAAPDCLQPIAIPLVVDLDGDAVPEVVLNAACDDDWQRGVLRAFRGTDGTPLWAVTDASLRTQGRSTPAAGDLDGDGRPEIVVMAARDDGRVLAFQGDGSLLWAARDVDGEPVRLANHQNGAVAIADLEGDGSPEVIVGAMVFDRTGLLRWRRDGAAGEGTNGTYSGGLAVPVDLDGDGLLEVVAGRRAYEHDGTPKWAARTPDGYPAVAQFDDDAQPEVVLVASGNVYLVDGLSGEVQWGPVRLPGGGIGGPPTVADFDGDGAPEIGVAGANNYTVYDPAEDDGVLWSRPTVDASSNATGSSVFDFEGDGAAEVVYADECHLWVYRGSDGEPLLQLPNSSATIHEYPLVVDVDADGNSELLIVANDRAPTIPTQCRSRYGSGWDGNRRGLFVYGDARDQWVRTRRVWNEHAYHVTNVEPDGTIPSPERSNWTVEGLNNFRQNVQGEGVFNAPDLVLLGLEVGLERCPEQLVLRARVANEGALGVPAGVPVAFFAGSPEAPGALLGVARTSGPLLPGESEVVRLEVPVPEGDPPYAFFARVDDDGSGAGEVAECREGDEAASIAEVACPSLG